MRPKRKKQFNIPKNPFLSTLIKLKRMQIDKEEEEIRRLEEERRTRESSELKKRKTVRKIGTIDDTSMFSYHRDRRRSKIMKPGLPSTTNLDQQSLDFYPKIGESPQLEEDEEEVTESEGTQLYLDEEELDR